MKRAMIVMGLGWVAACSSGSSGRASLPPVTMLSPDSAIQQQARFSPDGSRIVWWEPAGQVQQLWTAGADLKNPTKIPVTGFGTNAAFWSPDGSQVAVASSEGSLAEVTVIPIAGGPPKALTTNSGSASPIGWNPDGDRVVYLGIVGSGGGNFQTFVTSVRHGGSSPLIPGETRPYIGMWSPDGSRIAYYVWEGSKTTIWLADSTGHNGRQLTTDGFEQFGQADQVWSPDSKHIAYESKRTGTTDIWVIDVDSGAPRQLTRDIRNDNDANWSPDGKWLAFRSDRGKQTDLWVVASTGGPEFRITDDVNTEHVLQWLPKSNKLAYATGEYQSGIWALSLADSSEKRLTPDSIRAESPTLSPDGTQVLFRIERGGGVSDLAIMPVAGGAMRILVQGGNNSEWNWSPDGSRIAFMSDRSGATNAWVVDVAGGAPRQLVNWSGVQLNVTWNADGSALYFAADRDAKFLNIWRIPVTGGEPTRVTSTGNILSLMGHRGRSELYASIVNAAGKFGIVLVKPDGSLAPVWSGGNGFPVDLLPKGDSIAISVVVPGGVAFRLLPAAGGSEGKPLLNAGENFGSLSDDGRQLLYLIPVGATHDVGLLNRVDGTTRRLTNNASDEGSPAITPDGKTVIFQRWRTTRRIAIADLSKLLTATPKQ